MIDHVAHGVYISGFRAIYSAQALREAGIRHVLKLYEDEPFWPTDFIVCDNALSDGEPIPQDKLRRGVDFVKEHIASEQSVLVQCGAGISRSSTFVLAYLLERGYELPEAWRMLKANHEEASPHPAMWESLIVYYNLPFDVKEVTAWGWS